MVAVQMMCARLGMVRGEGLAGVIRRRYSKWGVMGARHRARDPQVAKRCRYRDTFLEPDHVLHHPHNRGHSARARQDDHLDHE